MKKFSLFATILIYAFMFNACYPVSQENNEVNLKTPTKTPGPISSTIDALSTGQTSTQTSLLPQFATQTSTSSTDSTPHLFTSQGPAHNIFGVETTWIDLGLIDKGKGLQTNWWRYPVFSWQKIEPENTDPLNYDWGSVDNSSLQKIAEQGITIIATVKYTPDWAQKYSGFSCGPIAQDQFTEFAQFMQTLVKKYSSPPYNIKHWELGNEVDVDRNLVSPDSQFGCWGEESDPFYGGGYYAEMLKVVYPAIKSADPSAKIMIGSLLLDCDPTNPPAGKTCLPAKFLEGILRRNGHNDGDQYFDIVGFHGYAYGNDDGKINDLSLPSWDLRGGVFIGKVDYLREVMANFSVYKPIMNTEVTLLCESCTASAFYEAQADYVVWNYVRGIAAGLEGVIWYTLDGPGWRQGGLLDQSQMPKNSYHAFAFLAQMLSSASYQGSPAQYPDLEAHEFSTSSKRILILWAPNQTDHIITVPSKTTQILDKYGNTLLPNQEKITVNSPIYIEQTP